MEIWIPNHADITSLSEKISSWIQEHDKYPYQIIIQERINSLFPSTFSPQSLYIAHYENKKLVFEISELYKLSVHICPICHEEDCVVRTVLPCKHEFHVHCIDRWLKNNNSCPVCRAKV